MLIIDCPKTKFTAAELEKLAVEFDVSITVRSKSRPNYMRIVVEGPEKSIQDLYGVAQQLIKEALSSKQCKRTIAQVIKDEPHAKPTNEIRIQPLDDQGVENHVDHIKHQPEAAIVGPRMTRHVGVSALPRYFSLLELSPYNHSNGFDYSGSSGDYSGSSSGYSASPGDSNIGQQWTFPSPLSTVRFNGSLAPGAEIRQRSCQCLSSSLFFGQRM